MLTHEQAAKQMGMAVREIIKVVALGDGHVVETHDGVHMLLLPGEKPVRYTGPLAVTPVEAVDDEPSTPDDGKRVNEGQAAAVPDGTVEQVLEWVGDDLDRAIAACEVEQARPKPRAGLMAALEKVVGR